MKDRNPLRTGSHCFDLRLSIFLSRIIDNFLTVDHCFDNGYVGKQVMASEEYFVQIKEFQGKHG